MKRIRTFAIAVAVALGGGISPIVPAAQAQYHGGVHIWTRYYSDHTLTTQVGSHIQYCDWWSEGSGQVTEYGTTDIYPCS